VGSRDRQDYLRAARHTDYTISVAFSPEGQHVVSGTIDRTIRVWRIGTSDVVSGPVENYPDPCFTHDAKLEEDGWILGSHGELLFSHQQ